MQRDLSEQEEIPTSLSECGGIFLSITNNALEYYQRINVYAAVNAISDI